MQEEVKNWWDQANEDLKAAKDSLKTRHYAWASFQAQQAAEKALKAFYLQRFKEIRRIHDLVFFAQKLELPSKQLEYCRKLALVYADTRYPTGDGVTPSRRFSEKDAIEFLRFAEVILRWLEKQF